VRIVNVRRHLLAALVAVADEDDGRELAVAHELLARGERLQQRLARKHLADARERLRRDLFVQVPVAVRDLARGKLLALQRVARAAVTQLHERARRRRVLEERAVLRANLRV
jgi:hypothetical protein